MKTPLIALVVACAGLASSVSRAAAPSPLEAEALAVEKQWIDATIKHDKPTLEKLMADDIIYIHGDGALETKAEFIASAMKPGRYMAWDLETTIVRAFGSNVVRISHKTLLHTKGMEAGESLFISFVWVKTGARWQLVLRQASEMWHDLKDGKRIVPNQKGKWGAPL